MSDICANPSPCDFGTAIPTVDSGQRKRVSVEEKVPSIPRVGVTAFGTGGPGTGLWTYLHQVVLALDAQELFEVDLVAPQVVIDELAAKTSRIEFLLAGGRSESPLRDLLWHHTQLPRLARQRRWDLVFAPVDRRCPLAAPCPVVTTVHDLAAFHLRGKYGRARGFFNRSFLPKALGRARRILCDSETTREDLHRFTPVDPARSEVVPLGVDREHFHPRRGPRDATILEHQQLSKPYILYTARLEHPAKNHLSLIRGFARLADAGLPHDLVLVGPPWSGSEAIFEEVAALGLKARVRITGLVPKDHLPVLFRNAAVFAFPSAAEGFGLPLLEAMASGTPVVSSDHPALREVAGRAALFCDGSDPAALAQRIRHVLEDPSLQGELREAGFACARSFSWEACGRRTIAALAEVLQLPASPWKHEQRLEGAASGSGA